MQARLTEDDRFVDQGAPAGSPRFDGEMKVTAKDIEAPLWPVFAATAFGVAAMALVLSTGGSGTVDELGVTTIVLASLISVAVWLASYVGILSIRGRLRNRRLRRQGKPCGDMLRVLAGFNGLAVAGFAPIPWTEVESVIYDTDSSSPPHVLYLYCSNGDVLQWVLPYNLDGQAAAFLAVLEHYRAVD